jgi:hypothetical protein
MSKVTPKVEYFHPAQLVLNERNPRKTLNISVLEKSIERYGFVNPVIGYRGKDGKVYVVAGHHRIKAAKAKGLDSIPVLLHAFANAEEAKAFGIMDNRSSEVVATWDFDVLRQEVDALLAASTETFDPTTLGFDREAFAKFLHDTEDMSAFTRPNFESELQDFEKSKHDKDGNWFYVEFYGEDDKFEQLKSHLKPHLTSPHQLDNTMFEEMVLAWLAHKK